MLGDLWDRLIALTGALVAPDWGALVALIPVMLGVVVLAFLVITAIKWASAGPSRRIPGRRLPLAPDGTPIRAPKYGPVVLAIGGFVAAFGLVAGSPVLAVGIGVALVGLVWWAIEVRAAAGRTLRLSPRRILLVGAIVLVVAILALTSRVVPDTPSAAAVPTVPPASPATSLPAADAQLTAVNIAFVPTSLTGPAGRPFTVAFDNQDGLPHNLEIRDASGAVLFRGDIVTGPIVTVYAIPSLPAGQYPFLCTVHPAMIGTLTVK
jgi:plastocyanin